MRFIDQLHKIIKHPDIRYIHIAHIYNTHRMSNAVTYYIDTLALYQTVFHYGCLIIMLRKIQKRRNNFNKIKLLTFVWTKNIIL